MATRRQFLARSGAAAAAAVVLAPQDAAIAAKKKRRRKPPSRAGLIPGGRFPQGVLSGDPAPGAITLLTLVDDVGGTGQVRLEVARDPDFRRVVARQDIWTTGAINHSVKARVSGLRPHERYWYRFETRNRNSPVGRFQTALPPDSRATVRFGFFSCADYPHGFYNAYAALAREDVDFVVSLGDYIYAETYMQVGDGRAVRDDPIGRENPYYRSIVREAATLPEYRAKYALYRSDENLRRLHQTFPMVATWDDHEVQNNYANDADDGGLPLRSRFSRARRDAAYQAYFEAMPVFHRGRSRGLPLRAARPHGRAADARRAPVPREPAVRRRDRLPVLELGPAADDPRPAPVQLAQAEAVGLGRRLEDRRRPVADDAQPRPRRRVPALRLVAGLPAGARAAARPPDLAADQGRRLPRRRHPHDGRGRRPDADGRRAVGGGRVRRRLDHLPGAGRGQLPDARPHADPGQRRQAEHAARHPGPLPRDQPVVRRARPRPPRLRDRHARRRPRST